MSDTLFGIIGLAIFLVVVFVAGYFFYKFKNARLTGAWGPLVGLVNGQVVGDGGGGATSWLTGTYKSRRVQASMIPNRNMYSSLGSDSTGGRYHYFDVALAETPGKQDWQLEYNRAILGIGQTGWRVKTKDPALETALSAAGILSLTGSLGEPPTHFQLPTLEYSSRQRLLSYRVDNGSTWTPAPERFMAMLELLLKADEINQQVNPV